MRTHLVLLAALACLASAGPARAGLYHPAEPIQPSADLIGFVKEQLPTLRSGGPPDGVIVRDDSTLRKAYLLKADQIKAAGLKTADDFTNLSAYYIRLRRVSDAVQVLETGIRRFPRDFQIAANLGTAYQLSGNLDLAQRYLQQALDLAPPQQRVFERYQLRLVQLRQAEQMKFGSRLIGREPLDALFEPPIAFVGEDGTWQVGTIAAAELKKLPTNPDAITIVKQLLVWLPDDARLHWLFGELANARGDLPSLQAAHLAMQTAISGLRLSNRDLLLHRVLLLEGIDWRLFFPRQGDEPPYQRLWILRTLAVSARPGFTSPDFAQSTVGHAHLLPILQSEIDEWKGTLDLMETPSKQAVWLARLVACGGDVLNVPGDFLPQTFLAAARSHIGPEEASPPPPETVKITPPVTVKTTPPAKPPWYDNFTISQYAMIGAGCALVLLLLALQVREWLRRRSGHAPVTARR